ncbi:MAG: hypothetical protein ACRDZ8_08735 [Acidimicrobiales bacterium]
MAHRLRATSWAGSARRSAVYTPLARRQIRPTLTAPDRVATLEASPKNTDPRAVGHGVAG